MATLVSRAIASRAPGSGTYVAGEGAITFFDSSLRIKHPPLSSKPSVLECMYAARHFDESWYPRSSPPPVDEAALQNETVTERIKRLKTTKYRTKRAEVRLAVQREEFFTSLLKKAEQACERHDVRKGGGHPLLGVGERKESTALQDNAKKYNKMGQKIG